MCPLYPFHVIILYLCLLLPLIFAVIEGADELSNWKLKFDPHSVEKLQQFNSTEVTLRCENCTFDGLDPQIAIRNEKENIASLQIQVIPANESFLFDYFLMLKLK